MHLACVAPVIDVAPNHDDKVANASLKLFHSFIFRM